MGAVPLTAAATVAAHALDYRLVVPNADARRALLAATGHDYETCRSRSRSSGRVHS